MHESVVASELIRKVCDLAAQAQSTRVLRVGVRLGDLSGVVPEALTFAFDIMRDGSACSDARLEIETTPDARDLLLTLVEVE